MTTPAAGSSRTGRSASLRLDAAPYVLRLDDAGRALLTPPNQPVTAISAWWLDDAGSLYAVTPAGPGIVLDRDLPALLDQCARTMAPYCWTPWPN